MEQGKETAVLGGGCFWCTEAVFNSLKGVHLISPGYTGGITENPTYEEVCAGKTGHAEVVKIEFNPAEITLDDILTVFFATHDPTTLNRQGNDIGTQYRSVIFYTTETQREKAERFIKNIDTPEKPVVTEVIPLKTFYPAEEEHKEYYLRNNKKPYCELVINPKLEKLKERFSELTKQSEQ